MPELLERAVDVLRAIRRFRWTALLVAWLVAVIGWAAIYQMPDRYIARARVFVDSNQILKPLLQGLTVQPDIDQQVALMSKTLLNRPNLEELARKADLDVQATTTYEKELLLDRLESALSLSTARGNSSLYTVSYTHENPVIARRVVQEMINIFVENTLGEEREDTTTAQQFLDRQIAEYERRLLTAERRLSEFKRENAGKMPGESGGYYQRLDLAKSSERAARLELREARNRRDALRRQLRDEQPAIPEGGVGAPPSATDEQLRAQVQELEELMLRYTERHPRVSQLRESIANLERRKEREQREGNTGTTPSYKLVPSPLYQELRTMLATADGRVAELEARVADYTEQIAELEATVDTIPKIEAELQDLDRDYAIIKSQYERLLERRESARLSERVEQNVDDVKFRVIDPPFVPSKPSSPDKPKLSAAVFVVALGAGGALAYGLALLRPVFYSAEAIALRSGRPVLGTISRQPMLRSRLGKTIGWIAFAGLALLLALAFALVMAVHLELIGAAQIEPLLRSPLGPLLESAQSVVRELAERGSRWLGEL